MGPVPTAPTLSQAAFRRYMNREARVWGARVHARRTHLGWSLDKAAKLAFSSPQTLSKVERGEIVARDHLRLAIAFALMCEPAELFPLPSRQAVLKDVA